jgi:hypothetical protein
MLIGRWPAIRPPLIFLSAAADKPGFFLQRSRGLTCSPVAGDPISE